MRHLFILACSLILTTNLMSQDYSAAYTAIDSLAKTGKYRSALDRATELYQTAERQGDQDDMLKALAYRAAFTLNLEEDGLQEALRLLTTELEANRARPLVSPVLNYLIGKGYFNYARQNSYRLRNATEVTGAAPPEPGVPLEDWTLRQLSNAADEYLFTALEEATRQRTALASVPAIITNADQADNGLTLYDLLARDVGGMLNDPLLGVNNTAPASAPDYLLPAGAFIVLNLAGLDENSGTARRLRLFQEQLAYHIETGGEGLLQTDLQRIEYVRGLGVADSLYLATLERMGSTYSDTPGSDIFLIKRAEILGQTQPGGVVKPKVKALELLEEVTDTNALIYNRKIELTAAINRTELSVATEEVYLPNRNLLYKVNYRNASILYLKLLRVPIGKIIELTHVSPDASEINSYAGFDVAVEKQFTLPSDGGDHESHTTEAWLPRQTPGAYLLLASTSADFDPKGVTTVVSHQVSGLKMTKYDDGDRDYYEIVEGSTGAALAGVSVETYTRKDRRGKDYLRRETLNTNAQGRINAPDYDGQNAVFVLRNGEDQLVSDSQYLYLRNRDSRTRIEPFTPLFTDRAIYRPGQTVHLYGVTLQRNRLREPELLAGRELTLSLRDANYQEVKTETVSSDEYGRFNVDFELPTSGLTGTFRIQTDGGTVAFRVEEYKRPRFEVELDGPDNLVGGQVAEFIGTANLYAGPAVNDAKVSYRVFVEEQRWYWWYRGGSGNGGGDRELVDFGEATTDAEGRFTMTFTPNADLARQRKRYRYTVEADVADETGEVRTAKIERPLRGEKPVIALQVKADYGVGDSLLIRASGADETVAIDYQISRVTKPSAALETRKWSFPQLPLLAKGEYEKLFPNLPATREQPLHDWPAEQTLAEGRRINLQEGKGEEALVLDDYPVGHYRIDWTYPDGTPGEPATFTVTDLEREALPAGKLFVIERLTDSVQLGQPIRFRLVSAVPLPHVTYSFLSRSGSTTKTVAANRSASVEYTPTDRDRGGIQLDVAFTYAGVLYHEQYNIEFGWDNKELAIGYATFRDNLRPGQPETWTLTVRNADGSPVDAAAVASMYDASLDQISPAQPWSLDPYPGIDRWRDFVQTFLSSTRSGQLARASKKLDLKALTPAPMLDPILSDWITRGRPIAVQSRFMNKRMRSSMAIEAVEEESAADYDVTGEAVAAGAPAPTPGAEDGAAEEAPVAIRKNLQETAFWLPKLTTNDGGDLVVSFTSPEALTRWRFRVLTHDKDLNFGASERDVVTQKELMVLPNVPRFLREGDALELTARVNNMTDSAMAVRTEIEFFDPATNEVIQVGAAAGAGECGTEQTVDANSGVSFCFPLSIPEGFSKRGLLGYRIVARADGFSDGEENVIPVLTDRTLVTVSKAFYLKKSDKKTVELPLLAGYDSETLQQVSYTFEATTNPAWMALKALPYLMEYPYDCTEQIANRFFANQLAFVTVTNKPVLETVFRQWQADSSALRSELDQNETLKNALLTETPWVRAAQSEAEQRARIAILFDLKRLAAEQQSTLNKLVNRQSGDGSYSWFPGGPGSRYITQYVVETMARMEQLGTITPNQSGPVRRITEQAVSYLDRELAEDYSDLRKRLVNEPKKLKEYQPSSTMVHYLYARALAGVDQPQGGEAREALDFYTRRAVATWTDFGLYEQAMLASAAFTEGAAPSQLYGEVGKTIIESLRERAIEKDEFGMYWKYGRGYRWNQLPIETHCRILEAFQLGGGTADELDEMRLWLLTNKRTNRWPTTKSTAAAVYAILNTGTDWVTTDTQPIDVKWPKLAKGSNLTNQVASAQASAEAATGSFQVAAPAGQTDRGLATVRVSNPDNDLVWGGVYWQYTEVASRVEASQDGPLSLERQLFRRVATDDGERLEPLTDANQALSAGDRVAVRLIVRSDRDLDFVHLKDRRAATFEPVKQLSGYQYSNGLGYYFAPGDLATNFFFGSLPKGTHTIEYDLFTTYSGTFSNGLGRVQCMYAPEFGANTDGATIVVE